MNIKKIIQGTIDEADELKTVSYQNGMEILYVPHEVYVITYEYDNSSETKEFVTYFVGGKVSLILSIIAEYMVETNTHEFDYTLAHRTPGFVKKMKFYLAKYNVE